MGELLLCHSPISAEPYDMKEISLHIYSVEELCYVMLHHPFLLEEKMFDEALAVWLEKEVGELEIAKALKGAIEEKLGIERRVECILKRAGYLSAVEKRQILEQIHLGHHKSAFERRKMRADNYVQTQKYMSAFQEYCKMLQMEEECRQNPVMCGNVWHNQGLLFARFFLFKEAKECFETAYKFNINQESLYAAMAASYFLGDKEEIGILAKKHGVEEKDFWNYWKEKETAAAKMDTLTETQNDLKTVFAEWKQEYQKNYT